MRDSVALFREKYSEEMRAFRSEQEAEMFFRKHHRALPQFPLNRMLSKPNPIKKTASIRWKLRKRDRD